MTKRILIVDDNQGIRKVLVDGLNYLFHAEAHGVASPTEARDLISSPEHTKYDVFLSDVHMSPVDGVEFYCWLRAERGIKGYKEHPFIFMTGNPENVHTLRPFLEEDLRAHVLEKPFGLDLLGKFLTRYGVRRKQQSP